MLLGQVLNQSAPILVCLDYSLSVTRKHIDQFMNRRTIEIFHQQQSLSFIFILLKFKDNSNFC